MFERLNIYKHWFDLTVIHLKVKIYDNKTWNYSNEITESSSCDVSRLWWALLHRWLFWTLHLSSLWGKADDVLKIHSSCRIESFYEWIEYDSIAYVRWLMKRKLFIHSPGQLMVHIIVKIWIQKKIFFNRNTKSLVEEPGSLSNSYYFMNVFIFRLFTIFITRT